MLRRSTALSFMLVMTLLITLKHPVLGYCLCIGEYVSMDCACEVEIKPVCTNCDSPSCNTETPSPCDDCFSGLNIDVGDFVWENITPPTYRLDESIKNSSVIPLASFNSIKVNNLYILDRPPSIALRSSITVPIYLRHMALLL